MGNDSDDLSEKESSRVTREKQSVYRDQDIFGQN